MSKEKTREEILESQLIELHSVLAMISDYVSDTVSNVISSTGGDSDTAKYNIESIQRDAAVAAVCDCITTLIANKSDQVSIRHIKKYLHDLRFRKVFPWKYSEDVKQWYWE